MVIETVISRHPKNPINYGKIHQFLVLWIFVFPFILDSTKIVNLQNQHFEDECPLKNLHPHFYYFEDVLFNCFLKNRSN
jgi:hypothetical protein